MIIFLDATPLQHFTLFHFQAIALPNNPHHPQPTPMEIHSPAVPIQNLVAVARSWVGEPEYIEAEDPILVDITFDETVRLIQMTIDPPLDEIRAGDRLTLRLYWDVLLPPPYNATVYIHIRDADGNLMAQLDREPLLDFRMETWKTGQRIMSVHSIQLPEGIEPDNLSLGMYRFDVGEVILPLLMSRDGTIVEQFSVPMNP